MKKTLIALSAIAVLSASSIAIAGHGRGGGGMFGPKLGRLIKSLDLRPDQQALAKRLKAKMKDKRKAIHAQMKKDMETLSIELKKASPNRELLHQLADRRTEAHKALVHERIDMFLELHATLDEAQRAKLAEHLSKMKDFEGHGHGHWKKNRQRDVQLQAE